MTVKDSIGITKDNLYSAQSFPIMQDGENVSSVPGAESAEAAFDHVVSFAGNGIAPGKRTAIDQQCAADAKNGTGSCSGTSAYDSSVSDLNKYSIQCGVTYTYPSPVTKKEITDADNDGMDDSWELARGLDPSDPTDYKGDYCGLGYNNIEYYINDLTVDSFPAGVVELSPENSFTGISAFDTIEAEDFTSQEGIQAEDGNIGYIENGDWVMFRKVDFEDGAHSFTAKVSGSPAVIEIYTDSLGGTPAAKVRFSGTTGYDDYQEITWGIPQISKEHNLYLRFTGGDGYLLNMDSFVFSKEIVPVGGKLIQDVDAYGSAHPLSWEVSDAVSAGSPVFGDRAFTFTEFPQEFAGAEQLLTACDDKGATGEMASFTAGADMELYIGLDSRLEKVPDWMSGYTKTTLTAYTDNDVTFELYSVKCSKGDKITLGGNGQSGYCVNYTIFAVPDSEPATEPHTEPETEAPTEPETETPNEPETKAPTEEPTAAPLYGDANGDSVVNVADAVAVLQFTANRSKYPLTDYQQLCADIDGAPGLTGSDAIIIQKVDAGLVNKADLPLKS